MHEHAIWATLEKRTSLRCKDLMNEVQADGGEVARGPASTPTGLGHSFDGHSHNQICTCHCISKRDSGLLVAATRAMSTVLAHNQQPSLLSNGEATTTRHWFFVEIHVVGIGQIHLLHDLVRLSLWCAARFGVRFVPSFPSYG
ncbi:hypothetical protein M9H77_30185 [Catharanthus roseus]|uniref:Uncharacterized protein n=1 Tax=Catharanthus roseus TaxID=4058 RepID=A0ACB9ZYT4_CATRO|nr:hypothetical protein M9H77_30185 [Catharanthus roseus]